MLSRTASSPVSSSEAESFLLIESILAFFSKKPVDKLIAQSAPAAFVEKVDLPIYGYRERHSFLFGVKPHQQPTEPGREQCPQHFCSGQIEAKRASVCG